MTRHALELLRDATWAPTLAGGVWLLSPALSPRHAWMTDGRRTRLLHWLVARTVTP